MNNINNYSLGNSNNYLKIIERREQLYLYSKKNNSFIDKNLKYKDKYDINTSAKNKESKNLLENIDSKLEIKNNKINTQTEIFTNAKGERVVSIKMPSGAIQYVKIGKISEISQNKNISNIEQISQDKSISDIKITLLNNDISKL